MLGFHDDALRLSGPAGSGLKARILGDYYAFWWKIVSGGPGEEYRLPAAIVDMNAGTGELYLEETRQTVLGSAGHALSLKYNLGLPTDALKVILVEENPDCFNHLRKVVERKWPDLPQDQATGPVSSNPSGVYLLNLQLHEALDAVKQLNLGNAIIFFDPLLHVEWRTIEQVARDRISYPMQTGTEFIIFVFTSDWFTGRHYTWRSELNPLPTSSDPDRWTLQEAESVRSGDALFGDARWRESVLTDTPQNDREVKFIESYRWRLLKWFRWVLALPFVPKAGQLYHLMLCSNYDAGVKATRDFYCDYTGNPRYAPPNTDAYARFRRFHPDTLHHIQGAARPVEWKVLWQIIRYCEGGICDERCSNIRNQGALDEIRSALAWLLEQGYIRPLTDIPMAWPQALLRYSLDWDKVGATLKIAPPPRLEPVTTDAVVRRDRNRA